MADEGGTQMHCPFCNEMRDCRGLSPSVMGKASEQRVERHDYPDLHLFRRCRECISCGKQFLTVEVNEDLIDELVELRDEVAILQKNAGRYLAESMAAKKSHEQMLQSLSILTDVELYQNPSPHAAKPIAELCLSVRAKNVLTRDVVTVGDLCQLTTKQLLKSPNFGETSLQEVREKLEALGLRLREE